MKDEMINQRLSDLLELYYNGTSSLTEEAEIRKLVDSLPAQHPLKSEMSVFSRYTRSVTSDFEAPRLTSRFKPGLGHLVIVGLVLLCMVQFSYIISLHRKVSDIEMSHEFASQELFDKLLQSGSALDRIKAIKLLNPAEARRSDIDKVEYALDFEENVNVKIAMLTYLNEVYKMQKYLNRSVVKKSVKDDELLIQFVKNKFDEF